MSLCYDRDIPVVIIVELFSFSNHIIASGGFCCLLKWTRKFRNIEWKLKHHNNYNVGEGYSLVSEVFLRVDLANASKAH